MALMTGEQYIQSIKNIRMQVYMFGKKIEDPTEDPILRPSLNSVRMTYDLAQLQPPLRPGGRGARTGGAAPRAAVRTAGRGGLRRCAGRVRLRRRVRGSPRTAGAACLHPPRSGGAAGRPAVAAGS